MEHIKFLLEAVTRLSGMMTELSKLLIKLNDLANKDSERIASLEADVSQLKGELQGKKIAPVNLN